LTDQFDRIYDELDRQLEQVQSSADSVASRAGLTATTSIVGAILVMAGGPVGVSSAGRAEP
jgi:hypothetical protein